jgi:hypothetical protein
MMSDRLEREIEEIFDKIEDFPAPESRRARARKRAVRRFGAAIAERQRAIARQLGRISVGQVMVISFLMILGSFFFRRFFSPAFMQWMLVAGVVLFVATLAIMFFGRGNPSVQQNWRGREIEYRTTPSLGERIRNWWRARGERRR